MIRIPCPECAGTGRWTCDGGNNPSARLYECEDCQGTGFEAEEMDPDRLREDRDERRRVA